MDATLARTLSAGVSKAKVTREIQFKEKADLFRFDQPGLEELMDSISYLDVT